MGIGQRLYRSAIDAALMVPGVVAVHHLAVDGLGPVLAAPGDFLDPGADSFFALAPGLVSIAGVSAGG